MNDQPKPSSLPDIYCSEVDVQGLSDWLISQAFDDPDVVEVFVGLCERLRDIGVQVDRANLAWPTLHPLFDAESVIWYPQTGAVLETLPHGSDRSDDWKKSPLKYAVEANLDMLRRRLAGPEAQADFPILQRLADEGMTDYLLFATRYSIPRVTENGDPGGVLVSWATKRPGGFTDREFATLKRLQGRLAIATKTMVLSRITRNVADAYLGRVAARRVLSGQIRHGDGEVIEAVVWYSDLRNSTKLAEMMPEGRYMDLLNRYFECVAGAALDRGGEVLDFIGDAVLAIFPLDPALEPAERVGGAITRACEAITEADARRRRMLEVDPGLPLDFGIGVDSGRLMFGNIGVPDRMTFSVIGPTVNQVARIEKYTKELDVLALATEAIALEAPHRWRPVGAHDLVGLSHSIELFAWRDDAAAGLSPAAVTGR
ncbi:adenylate/guanylate cyclase domain-containing protein [Microbaculum marinum]|uniref:Adenylate/guanylate cyclase domain-containing protein n=1 Tax=Microbaculum marinum TaxID=1764581 RepID=A0AAW9RQ09_9HYPH